MPETEDAFEYLYHTISSSESSKTSVFWFQIASFDLVFDAMSYLEINNGMNSTSWPLEPSAPTTSSKKHYQAGAWKAPTTSPCVESKCIDAPVVSNAVGLQVRNTGRATEGRGWAYFWGIKIQISNSKSWVWLKSLLEHPLDHPIKMTKLVVLPALIRSNTSSHLHWVWQWYGTSRQNVVSGHDVTCWLSIGMKSFIWI